MDLDCSKDADADIAEDRQSTTFTEIVSSLTEQAEDLCQIHDHVTRVVAGLDVKASWFHGYCFRIKLILGLSQLR